MRRIVGVLVAAALTASSIAAAGTNPAREREQHAQAWGFRCQTQLGVCPIAPQSLGSPCWCGAAPGFVVP